MPLGELMIVADGIGGYQGGAVASRLVVEGFCSYLAGLPADYPPDRAIEEASATANAEVYATAKAPDSPYHRMGSTVVLALLRQTPESQGGAESETEVHAWIGHIGDSRAYLMREGRLSRITTDHSAVQSLLNRNLITPEEARHHPDASVLTRSLGHQAEVEIDIEKVELTSGDTLLLCSDGLWGYVEEQQIASVLASVVADPALTAQAASQALLDLALDVGGQDNIGIELARLSLLSPTTAPPVRRRPRLLQILAVFLLVFAGMGALVALGLRHNWLHALRHLR